jgi:hypothetical protein
MAKRTQKPAKKSVARHITPYEAYYGSPLWKAVDAALALLEGNQDVEISTSRDLVVGLICEHVSNVKSESPNESTKGVEVLRALKLAGLVIKRSPALATS